MLVHASFFFLKFLNQSHLYGEAAFLSHHGLQINKHEKVSHLILFLQEHGASE